MEKQRVKKMFEKLKEKEQTERLEPFVSRHRKKALGIDLSKESYTVNEKLETQKSKYLNAELENEIKEVNTYCYLVLRKVKADISKYIRDSEQTKMKWVNCTPPFLIDVRLYLEYDNLYYNTLNPKLSIEGAPIKNTNHNNNGANILYNIHNQLGDLKKLVDNQIKRGFQIYNYYVCENKYTLLDTHTLMVYLTEKKIENTYLLKSINERCFEIMELWNNELHKLPEKELKEWFHYHDDKRQFSVNSKNDFYAIYLDNNFRFYNNKKLFFGSYNCEYYTAHTIATKCYSIINKITAAYPETDPTLPEQSKKEPKAINLEATPTLNPETLKPLFTILKGFFNPEQQSELKQILGSFDNADKKLLFQSNGNRLADTFKKLIEHDFITGLQKKDLNQWIVSNFLFYHNGETKEFNAKTLEKNISGNNSPCKNPLIEIKNGQIEKVEKPKAKKYD